MLLTKQLLELRPRKMDMIFATKTCFASLMALYIAFSLDLSNPLWSMATVFLLANPYSGMVSSKSFYRIMGTLTGSAVAVLLTPRLIHMPWLFTFCMSAWVGFCLYISLLDRTARSYFFMLAGYTVVIITFNDILYINEFSIFDMALGRFIEISIGVVCSAVVSATIFPVHLGPVLQSRVGKTLQDTEALFRVILSDQAHQTNYMELLARVNHDTSEIHALSVHLWYEKSKFRGTTKPLQELLHQLSILTTNLVSMSERLAQLDEIDLGYREALKVLQKDVDQFLVSSTTLPEQYLNVLPQQFDDDFEAVFKSALPSQQVMLHSLKMDIRHFIQNVQTVKIIWYLIQKGEKHLPPHIVSLSTSYPSLHRDYGVAVRGGISAFLAIFIAGAMWIITGWKYGYMVASLTSICVCIMASMDNPVPALKIFIRATFYTAVVVFIYAFGVLPYVTEFWQLALVLAPFIIFCVSLFPHPPLSSLALPLLMCSIMELNLQNKYVLDQIATLDGSLANLIGPTIAAIVIYFVRAMSPDITATRILTLHYKSVRESMYLPFGLEFKIQLCSMLDRIGILNTKQVQSAELKREINLALIEVSAVIDLTRINELLNKMPQDNTLTQKLDHLQQLLDDYFRSKQLHLEHEMLRNNLIDQINLIQEQSLSFPDADISQRLQISLNNIRSSLYRSIGHEPVNQEVRVV